VISDYDADGNAVGVEVLNPSARVESPQRMEYAIAG